MSGPWGRCDVSETDDRDDRNDVRSWLDALTKQKSKSSSSSCASDIHKVATIAVERKSSGRAAWTGKRSWTS
jgi:hypothetical protein